MGMIKHTPLPNLIMKKALSDSPVWQLKKRELLLPLSFLIKKPIKLDSSNLHCRPHYRTQGCVIREKTITAPVRNPTKDTLVPLQINFNANGSVRCSTTVYLNLFHWPMGKISGYRSSIVLIYILCLFLSSPPSSSCSSSDSLNCSTCCFLSSFKSNSGTESRPGPA